MSARVNPGGRMKVHRPKPKAHVNPGGVMRGGTHPGKPVNPGGAMKGHSSKGHPNVNPGGPAQIARPAPKPFVNPGGAMKKKGKKKGRGLALDGLPCCVAQALAASLAVAGGSVSADDVEALYWHTAEDADAGASILTALEAAWGYGFGGHFPAGWRYARGPAVILGLDMPAGPHAVFDDGRSWWSWGERYDPADFPGAVVEEAWAVSWS